MKNSLIIKLDTDYPDGLIRTMGDTVNLAEGNTRSVETLTRIFKFPADHYYGELEINRKMMQQMIMNFDKGTYGQKIYVNIAHMDHEGAAGEITRVFLDGNRLRGEINWTEFGLDAIRKRGFRYFSAEFVEDYQNPETEDRHGALLLGAAITIRPRVKRLDPINPDKLMLSEDPDEDAPIIILPNVKKLLSEEITTMWEKLIKKLQDELKKLNLSDENVTKLTDGFKKSVVNITDEPVAKALQENMLETAQALADQGDGDRTIELNISVPAGEGDQKTLSEDDVNKLVAAQMKTLQEEEAKKAAKLQETRENNIKLLHDTVEASEGFKTLDAEEQKLILCDDLITAEMSEDQVMALAGHQLEMVNRMSINKQLAARGFEMPQGHVHITVEQSNAINKLQETIDKRLGFAALDEGERFEKHGGKLPSRVKKLADDVLAVFDHERGRQLHEEAKHLDGGSGDISDVAVPVIVERTVIREMLYQLTALNFVDVGTYPFANVANIAYSYRDTTAAGKSDARVYEGGAIPRAGVIQTTEEARPIPQKIACLVSDEMRYLTSASVLNWETVAENTRNMIRIIGEDTEQTIMNEILQATLEYGAVAVSNEDLELQADDTNNVFVLANFPVVRPRTVYDLQGNAVGSTVNPITVSYNSVGLSEYDGTGNQQAGTYYVLDYDLGEIYLVDESGAIQTPANTTPYTISYSYATNVYAWDYDLGSLAVEKKWNDFLYRYGLRKALIKSQRYHRADLGIMSDTFKTSVERADTFGANYSRPGTDLTIDGDLGKIKGVPNFSTTAPGLHIGDRYALIGERNTTRFRMMKAWMMSDWENAKDSNGKFTGQKTAYGDQFIVCHTPTQLKRANTALLTYSDSARVARVNP